jgi:(1->4)-alpha-D-glucan 1-alpha-D-glucosylmutase
MGLTDGDLRAPSVTFVLYQALLGAWQPDDASFAERMQEYALKAAREGKQETSWFNPQERYEAGIRNFIAKILEPPCSGEFLASLQMLVKRLSLLGALNSLSQITLKATSDFYQGAELWDFSLVDPDNRRPVDFATRARLLEAVEEPDWNRLVREWPSGHLKLAWTRQLLKLRTELAEVFTDGDYEPLEVTGRHCDHSSLSRGGTAIRRRSSSSRAGSRHSPIMAAIGRRRRCMIRR